MNKRLVSAAVFIAMGAAYTLAAHAQAKPDVLVKQRQAAMVLQGKYFYGHLRPVAQGKMPYDAALVARNVAFLDALAKMPWDGFAPSTKDLKSGATPAVFAEPAKFKEAADRFQSEVTRLSEVTRKGDEAAIRAQILAVNKTCGACHDNFRERQ
jgi:cytochrome c556